MSDIPLGPYLLHDPIGRGATGEVWRGVHASQGVPVAVKILKRDVDTEAVRREVEAVAALSHPGIVLLYDTGDVPAATAAASAGELQAGQAYLAMELVSGGSLRDAPSPSHWGELAGVLDGLLDALAHAHARGIVHRDLKPSNVLVAGPGDLRPGLKLSDFGIAHSFRGRFDRRITGTPRYMAPEQFRGAWRDMGPWTDLYALGVLVWELATGAPLFDGDAQELSHHHLYDVPPAFEPRLDVPDGLDGWLHRLLAKDPGHRFRRAADAAWALRTLGPIRPSTGPARLPVRPRAALTVETLADLLEGDNVDPDRTLTDVLPTPVHAELDDHGPSPVVVQLPPMPLDWRRAATPPPDQLLGAGLGLYDLRHIDLVGRTHERDALWAALASVHHDRRARAVIIRGASGVGKTALGRWMLERVHETGAGTPLRVHHDAERGSNHGLAAAIARTLGLRRLSHDRTVTRLQRHLTRRGRNDAADAEALAALLLPDDEMPDHVRDAAARRATFTQVLAGEGLHRPLVVWMDDVAHGADSLEVVHDLVSSDDEAPVLVVITAQEEALAASQEARDLLDALTMRPRVHRLDLAPLSLDETRTLVQSLLPVADDLARRVSERVDGNPLFAVQLLGDWVQRGLLVPREGRYDLESGAMPPLPDDLHEVWSERLESLLVDALEGARPALEIAAALGQWVDDKEWRDAADVAGVSVPRRLVGRLVREHLAIPARRSWRFAHGMLRESIVRRAREEGRWAHANQACATILEDRPGVGALGRRGRHLLEAGERSLGVEALLEAARHHVQRDEARLASTLLDLAGQALDTHDDTVPADARARWALLTARVHKSRNDLERADALAAQVLALPDDVATSLRADALAERADVARVRGDLPRATELFEQALAAYDAAGDTAGGADTLRSLSDVALHQGDHELAAERLDRARGVYDERGDKVGAALALAGLGDLARMRGELDLARDRYRDALTVLRAEGHRSGIALGLHGLAEVHRLQGRPDEAEKGYQEVIRLDASLGRDASIGRYNLALCHLDRARWVEALQILEELERTWSRSGRPGYLAAVHVAALPGRAALGQWSAWHRHVGEARRLLSASLFVDVDLARAATTAGSLAAEAGRATEARQAWTLAREQWAAMGADAEVAKVDALLEATSDDAA